jgi:hypothetical protein
MLATYIFIPYAYAAVDAAAFGKALDPIITQIVTPIVLFAFGIGVFMFVWGVIEMIRKADDPAARSTGWKHILLVLSEWLLCYLLGG